MELLISRQPILDESIAVHGYELRSPSSAEELVFEGARAASPAQAVADATTVFGLEELAVGKRLFLEVTEGLLASGALLGLASKSVVLEVPERLAMDSEAVAACARLRQVGLGLALEGATRPARLESLLPLLSYVTVDFQQTTQEQRRSLVERLKSTDVALVAKRVDTRPHLGEARRSGFRLFQGQWFSEPELISEQDVPGTRLAQLRLLNALSKPTLDLGEFEEILRGDVAFSVKLLRFLNSASFGWKSEVRTVKQALVLLGDEPFRRWATLASLGTVGQGRPEELLVTSLVRAEFMEAFGHATFPVESPVSYFLTGLLSCLDAVVGRPMAVLLKDLSLPAATMGALLGNRKSSVGQTLLLAQAIEAGRWERVEQLREQLGAKPAVMHEAYRAALGRADGLVRQLDAVRA